MGESPNVMMEADRIGSRHPDLAGDNFSARDALLGWMQEIAPFGIFTTDAELRIRTWNHWLATHSGRTPDQVIGRLLTEVYPDVQQRRLDEHFQRALKGEISVLSTALHKYLLQLPTASDELGARYMLQTVRIAPLPAGDLIVGTITIIEDVTQRERHAMRLQRQQEHDRVLSSVLRVLLQSADPLRDVSALFPTVTLPLGLDGYLNHMYDADGAVLRLNAAGGILPKHKEELAVLRLGDGLCGECALHRKGVIRTFLQDADDAAAQTIRRLGFRTYCCFPLLIESRLLGTLSFASSTRDLLNAPEIECLSTVAQYVAIAMDRALRERALQEAQRGLREHADALETKVTERTAKLHDTIVQLESFSYTVAHDLRAPIRSLRGYCDILQSDYALPEGGRAILDRLQRATTRLDALTRDLLKFTRISRQEIQLEVVDLAELVDDVILLGPPLQEVLVARPPLGKVWAQRTLLQQCLSNLFDNAMKFVAPGNTPRIVVRAESVAAPAQETAPTETAFHPATHTAEGASPAHPALAGPWTRIWVEDSGIGIAPEAHAKIFGVFERVSGLDHIDGTGIGLAIVARAVQRMNGRCGVESTLGKGSRFWLELPTAESPAIESLP
jgi:PAS domain S-box-containing protein